MLALTNNSVSHGSKLSAVIAEINRYYSVNVDAGQELADWMAQSFCPQTVYAIINWRKLLPVLIIMVMVF